MSNPSLILPQSPAYGEDYVYAAQVEDGAVPLYNVLPLTFTRASGGTRINKDGLVQNMPYNLLLQSNSFDTTWSTITSNLTSGQAGYDGTNNAWLLTKTAGNGRVEQSISASGSLTFSVYAKANANDWILLRTDTTGGVRTSYFNISSGAIGLSSNCTPTIESAGNGYYRCSISFNDSVTIFRIYVGDSNGSSLGASGNILIQNAQVNIGSTAQPYLATTDRLNMPRITYPVGGGCGALLLEKQSTNYCLWSNDLTQLSAWIDQTSNTTLTQISTGGPDGGSFTRLVSTGSGNMGRMVQSGSITNPNSGTMSVYLKGSGTVGYGLFIGNGISQYSTITLTNTWTRYTVTASGTGGTYQDWEIVCYGGSTIDVSFVQIEVGSYATSPIPTTSSSATRVADACSKTGVSSLIGQTEGTMFVDFVYSAKTGNNRFSISAGSSTNWIFIGTPEDGANNASRFYIKTNNIVHVDVGGSSYFTFGQRYKLALAYKSGDWAVYGNGTLLYSGTDAIAAVSSPLSVFNFFSATGGVCDAAELINQALLFKTRLTNAELATLTTI